LAFTNLAASTEYQFTIYGARGNNGNISTFTPTLSASDNGADSISNVFENSTVISGISTASGEFTIEWTSPGGGKTAVQGQ